MSAPLSSASLRELAPALTATTFADTVARVATLRGEGGVTFPADVEFGFSGGRLTLLQIRPMVESRAAQRNAYLLSLDTAARERASMRIPLDVPPGARAP